MYNGFIVKESMINGKKYDGNTFKYGITVDKEDYIVKRPKDCISSLYSEHIASNFIGGIGVNCHETWLGYDSTGLVVILKDFCINGASLRSYKSTEQSSEDTDITNKNYTYTDVIYMIHQHTKMSDIEKHRATVQFWDMFICDAILGNRDRHRGNWGYLVYRSVYKPAPIYDNGASLFPDIAIKINEYAYCINTGKEFNFIAERSEKFPASLFQMERADGKIRRTNYYEILSDLRINKILASEVKSLREKVGFNQIYETTLRIMISVKMIVPKEYRRFYILIICTRYLHMIERKTIKESYVRAVRRLNNESREW
jgi:hypothetical protein